ncbi:hypothetical protein [Massilia glaciei]|uniref:Uncharacterized protein n=1 Tax=Massilia glaciei TaxID=1524097 RepID=A0A2U2HND2_9BURK|nr:hypothetical protein [Massilia glaciei]PWF49021.1 hypothetical protein C7C56_009040 [Massilia glaciei]
MRIFTDAEIASLNLLASDAQSRPYFDAMRWALRWHDETPQEARGESYQRLLDLVVARSFIHQGRAREHWFALTPTSYYADIWDEALARAPAWPGFKRLALTNEERAYLHLESTRTLTAHIS